MRLARLRLDSRSIVITLSVTRHHCSVHKTRTESPSQMCMFDKCHFDYNLLLFTPFLTV